MLRRRFIVIVLATVLVVVAGAAGTVYWYLSRDGLRRALEAQASAWLGHPVRIGAARGQVFPRVAIQLKDIRVGEPAQLTLADVELAADLRALIDRRIENADVLVSGSVIDMPLPFGLPRGGSTKAEPTPEDGIRLVSIRSIALRSVRLRSRSQEIVVSADSALDGATLTLARFTAETGETALAADGVIALAPRVEAGLKATANRLNIDELVALANAFSPESSGERGTSAGQAPRIVATVSADQATVGALQARRFTTELVADGESIALNPLRFELFGGRYDGSLNARLGKTLSARLESRITDIDVAQLTAFAGSPDTVTGRLSGSGTFTGSGADIAQLLHDASGKATATILSGSIRRLHLVRTVILFFGRPAPQTEEATDRFDRIDAGFSLANRVVRAETFSLHSPDADMVGEGTLNLDTDALNGRVDISLSEALSAQAGTDLYRYTREGTRVVLPASIGGSLSNPRLAIDVGAAAKRGLRNEVQRRIEDLFKGLGR